MTPCLVAWPMAAIMAVGVASTRAQGQNTTSTVTAVMIFWLNRYAKMAMSSATGTSQLAALSAMRCMGACLFSASWTMRISFCRELFSPTLVAVMSMEPKRLMVPQKTSSPTPLSTGRDSPVMMDWSTEVSPWIMVPSTGMVSPGRIRRVSPCRISSAGTISSVPLLIRRPFVGARRIS